MDYNDFMIGMEEYLQAKENFFKKLDELHAEIQDTIGIRVWKVKLTCNDKVVFHTSNGIPEAELKELESRNIFVDYVHNDCMHYDYTYVLKKESFKRRKNGGGSIMKFEGKRTKALSVRVTPEMFRLIKGNKIDMYDVLVWFLSEHHEEELSRYYLLQCEQRLSKLKNEEQVELEKRINEIKERLNHEL